jgi:hypothetical protein
MDIGLYFFIFYFSLKILDWFRSLSLLSSLAILCTAGGFFLMIIFLWRKSSHALIGGVFFKYLPQNAFTIISTFLLSIANAVLGIFWLWRVPKHYDLMVIFELLVLSLFIWVLCTVAMPAREQLKNYE